MHCLEYTKVNIVLISQHYLKLIL